MRTRGLWGFKYNNEAKYTYNHYDSYVSGLGFNLKEELRNYTLGEMRDRFDKIILVNDTSRVPPNIMHELAKKGYVHFDEKDLNRGMEWYFALRDWQGKLRPYMEYDMPYMTDGSFYDIWDIEYIYKIDLDNATFHTIMCREKLECTIALDDLRNMSNWEYEDEVSNNAKVIQTPHDFG